VAGGDLADRDRRRLPPWLAEALLVERLRHGQPDVDAHEIHQLERSHLEPAPLAHDPVDQLERRDSLGQQLERLDAPGPVAAVDEESGTVDGVDHALAHRLAGGASGAERRVGGLRSGDDLEQRHHRGWVEEVHPDDALWVG
jgi:hypothetical protein